MTYPVALWPDWALPETMAPHLQQLPSGYFRLLLAATLTLTPPDPIPSLLGTGRAIPAPYPRCACTATPWERDTQAREAKRAERHILPCWFAKASNGWRLSSAGSGRFNHKIRPSYRRFWDSNSA